MIAGIFGGSGFVFSCRGVLSNSDLSPHLVHRTAAPVRDKPPFRAGKDRADGVAAPAF